VIVEPPVTGPVLVIGTGLIGTSIALSLQRSGVEVLLSDVDDENLQIAIAAGAGRMVTGADVPSIVVVSVPPRLAAWVIAQASADHPDATITDVTSVKARVMAEAIRLGADPVRLVGGHPMAGREVSGSAGARRELLDDRLWVVAPLETSGAEHVARVRQLVTTCRAVPVEMGLSEHDAAVALVSHTPQVLSSVLAAQLVDSRPEYVQIAGQGLRDMTRIAASNVSMWSDILASNAGQVADVLEGVVADLQRTVASLRELDDAPEGEAADDGVADVRGLLETGVAGQALIPGKHGDPAAAFREVTVLLADRPGELGRLFNAVGVAQVNLEDVRIEHIYGRPSGLVALYVQPDAGDRLVDALQALSFDVRA
jgi:prephenate dehydrogenase